MAQQERIEDSLSAGQISEHEIRVYEAAKASNRWLTAREIAVAADVADRTARTHAAALVTIGVFEVSKVFGGYRYRLKPAFEATASDYLARLEAAKKVLGA
jgi:predicted DNA-binding transcriptional regulator